MPTVKENATSLYKEGILKGNARSAIEEYTGDHYTQHSTGVADGKEGFLNFFEPFLKRCPVREFTFVRALQEGKNAFLQVAQDINNGDSKWLTTDFFDSDDHGKIIEHWDVISAIKPPNPSGRTQIDGPTDIVDLEKTAENKQLVLNFINTVLVKRDLASVDKFIGDVYMQHNSDVGDGKQAFLAFFGVEDCPLKYQECFMSVAEGNFVATLNRASLGGQDLCLVDLFRVEDGKIVEHWDNSEPVPPKEEWANSGKF